MKNKPLSIMLIILVSITLVGAIAVVVIMKTANDDPNKKPSIDDIIAMSVDIPEITTNLKDDQYVKLSLKAQTDSKDAKDELEKRDFQVKNILIEELSEMSAKDLDGKKGKEKLEEVIKSRTNALMQDGKVDKVYITSYIIQ
ncbi:flagellar basal body-associated protein FliL [Falsibacillus albus]|uniref:Flagellar protein FliL n=1 Tax=Falsibacillus albus TaxID=2478915 RepID=A0A3L7JY61_9BACI|nr:flagellar basal body-associated protein FliL [Falsibacillus albus]RLQ95737.1 flagellar basal body-associated protein FliL [Falsibacillus albus]